MPIFSKHYYVYCKYDAEIARNAIVELEKHGFLPLISRTKDSLFSLWGKADVRDLGFVVSWIGPSETNRPLVGELFFSEDKKGILYLALFGSDEVFKHPRLQIGAIGSIAVQALFPKFYSAVKKTYPNRGKRKWSPYGVISTRFSNFSSEDGVQFSYASEISSESLDKSKILEDIAARTLALRIKASGGVLASDLKKVPVPDGDKKAALELLTAGGLLDREYVVICRKSSNQIIRIQDPQELKSMSAVGTLCSCGAPIADERTEEFVRPSKALVALLNGSAWMNAKLVDAMVSAGISKSRILLGVQEGSEEVDAFADYNAQILMFEMKDGQFSMKHAYSFGARMAIYRPQFALIIATKGIAPEVKTHFERIKPEPTIFYVETFEQVSSTIRSIVDKIQSEFAMKLLIGFEPLVKFEMPLARTIGYNIGLDEETIRNTPDLGEMKSNSAFWKR